MSPGRASWGYTVDEICFSDGIGAEEATLHQARPLILLAPYCQLWLAATLQRVRQNSILAPHRDPWYFLVTPHPELTSHNPAEYLAWEKAKCDQGGLTVCRRGLIFKGKIWYWNSPPRSCQNESCNCFCSCSDLCPSTNKRKFPCWSLIFWKSACTLVINYIHLLFILLCYGFKPDLQ